MQHKIICEYRTYPDIADTHLHSYVQLILPLQGLMNIETDHKKFKLNESHLFLLPPDCTHTFWSNQNNRFLVLDIPLSMFSVGELKNFPGGINYKMDENWQAIRTLLLNEVSGGNGSYSSINMLFHYFKKFLYKNGILDSVKYIHKHFNEDIKLEKLAEIEHYHVNYYCEWFKRIMNYTPMEYLKKIRIEHAKKLLLGSNLTILQIAWEVGYAHQSSFVKAFKEIEHMTPTAFKRKNMKIG